MQTKRSPISNSGLNPNLNCGARFRRQEHLKRRVELTRVFKKGRVVRYRDMKLFFLANELPYNRIAFTFIRKYGNAVERNRARRLSREAYRLMKGDLKTGYDLVLLICRRTMGAESNHPKLPREKPCRTSLAESAEWLKALFTKAGMSCGAQSREEKNTPPGDG